ncbi:hypothetical protein H4W34_001574 [Actinomadura algeriensis]|uniref:Uncharacterized protein n=1 Tax=Actinomadura algeriensis TaxID=1679523 RepID=A0ABR9JMF4_9ACTN|nr:hypothetical protein [Actinomadura algeriensis]MBE1531741.1 hypothetical protein [Actinomadura algeriensis]
MNGPHDVQLVGNGQFGKVPTLPDRERNRNSTESIDQHPPSLRERGIRTRTVATGVQINQPLNLNTDYLHQLTPTLDSAKRDSETIRAIERVTKPSQTQLGASAPLAQKRVNTEKVFKQRSTRMCDATSAPID